MQLKNCYEEIKVVFIVSPLMYQSFPIVCNDVAILPPRKSTDVSKIASVGKLLMNTQQRFRTHLNGRIRLVFVRTWHLLGNMWFFICICTGNTHSAYRVSYRKKCYISCTVYTLSINYSSDLIFFFIFPFNVISKTILIDTFQFWALEWLLKLSVFKTWFDCINK